MARFDDDDTVTRPVPTLAQLGDFDDTCTADVMGLRAAAAAGNDDDTETR